MNPELKRYIWLEANTSQLIIIALVLSLIDIIAFNVPYSEQSSKFALIVVSSGAYILFTFWGSRRVVDSVVSEIIDSTWDFQRMSSLSAWTMTWGKLVGASLAQWFGRLICLLVGGWAAFALYADQYGSTVIGECILILVLGAILVESTALLGCLEGTSILRAAPRIRRRPINLGFLVLIFFLIGLVPEQKAIVAAKTLTWWSGEVSILDFSLFTLIVFCVWMIIGAYRLMKVELQYRVAPWYWLCFQIFLGWYLLPLIPWKNVETFGGLLTVYCTLMAIIAYVFCYALIFREDCNPIRFRRLWLLANGSFAGVLPFIPKWFVSLSIVIVCGALVIVCPSEARSGHAAAFTILTALSFLIRDIAIILALELHSRKIVQVNFGATAFMVIFYALVPQLLYVLGFGGLVKCFLPSLVGDATSLFASLPGLAIGLTLLWNASRATRIGLETA